MHSNSSNWSKRRIPFQRSLELFSYSRNYAWAHRSILSHHNYVAERMSSTLLLLTRALSQNKNIDKALRGKLLLTATYVKIVKSVVLFPEVELPFISGKVMNSQLATFVNFYQNAVHSTGQRYAGALQQKLARNLHWIFRSKGMDTDYWILKPQI